MNKKIVSLYLLFAMALAVAPSAVVYAADTQAPTVPQNLTATALSVSRIDLSWSTSTDDVAVTGYKVFRNDTQIASTADSVYSDLGLSASTTYSYTVSAFDAAGNESAKSLTATATTLADVQSPTVPTNLSAITISPTQINLTWTASTDNVGVTGYKIFRDNIEVGNPASPAFSDTGLTASTTYAYNVLAFDAAGNRSGKSATVTAATIMDTQSPSIPTNLTATPVSTSQINLVWTVSTDNVGVTGYKIFRDNAQVGSATTAAFSDTGLSASTTYAYNVSAYDATGNVSDKSATVTATTLITNPTPTPTDLTVKIDVRPGNSQNQINLRSNMLVPVALFGSSNFDVANVSLDSLVFAGVKTAGIWTRDVNRDGIKDLLLYFRPAGMNLDASSTQATLNGMTKDGKVFTGSDKVKVLNGKKRNKRSGDDMMKRMKAELESLRQKAKNLREKIRQQQEKIKEANKRKQEEMKKKTEEIRKRTDARLSEIKTKMTAKSNIQAQVKQDIKTVRTETRQEIKQIKQEAKNGMKQIKDDAKNNRKGNK